MDQNLAAGDHFAGMPDPGEKQPIAEAEDQIRMAQVMALGNRLNDFVVYLQETGYIAKNAYDRGNGADDIFEICIGYLNEAIEHEDEHPLTQILRPDMSGFSGEPE